MNFYLKSTTGFFATKGLRMSAVGVNGLKEPNYNGLVGAERNGRCDCLLQAICKQSHAPFLFRAADKTVFLAWFSGDGEGASRCANVVSRLQVNADGSKSFTTPVVASVQSGKSNQNPVVFQKIDEPQRLYLLHPSQDAGPFGVMQKTSEVRLVHSDDNGVTWSEPEVVFARGTGAFVRGPILNSVDKKEYLLPMYFTPQGEFDRDNQYCCVRRSKGDLKSWPVEARLPGSRGAVGVQPWVVRAKDNSLVAFMRNRTGGNIMRSTSDDDGQTWSKLTATPLPSNNSSVTALLLADETLVLCFNNTQGRRYPLTIALSKDLGVTFYHVRDVVDSSIMGGGLDGPSVAYLGGEYSYPTLLLPDKVDGFGEDGVLLAWTHCRMTVAFAYLSREWLDGGDNFSLGDFRHREEDTQQSEQENPPSSDPPSKKKKSKRR